jgi:hypothetical protein
MKVSQTDGSHRASVRSERIWSNDEHDSQARMEVIIREAVQFQQGVK